MDEEDVRDSQNRFRISKVYDTAAYKSVISVMYHIV